MSEVNQFDAHLERLKAGSSEARALDQVSLWIEQKTHLNGRPYSYKGHEYQPFILDASEPEWVIQKCSQVGITEMSIRMALALCGMIRGFTIAYTLPTAKFAGTVMKTRVNPVIESSPHLRQEVSDIDNVEVKRIGNSYLYLKGAAGTNAPISVPCDMRIHDEVDFSDPVVLSQYHSRMTHSPYKFKGQLSTPTLPGKGINAEFAHTRRHFNFVKCHHCNHLFIPDYFEHVRIPGFTGDLRDINKQNLPTTRYKEAYVECPSCGGKPSLLPEHREWVLENPDDNYAAFGVQVSPFDAPTLITPGYLIESSTQYRKLSDFVNFGLGTPMEDKDSTMTQDEMRSMIVSSFNLDSGVTHVMGLDLGKTCWATVCAVHADGGMRIIHVEPIPVHELRDRYHALRLEWRVRLTVSDSMPYTETILTLQKQDLNLFGAVYLERNRNLSLFTVKDSEADPDKGTQPVRQVNIVRDRSFDAFMEFARSGQLSKRPCEYDDVWVSHMTDMRRIKDWDAGAQEMGTKWVKSSTAEDHLHHSALYAYIAAQMLGASKGTATGLPPMMTFRTTA